MVFLVVCDADYCLTVFNFGSYGSNNDCEGLETNAFNILENEPLGGCNFTPLPYFLLGDDIFPH